MGEVYMDEYEQAALKFVNEVRVELGSQPLAKIARGVPRSPCNCPIARSIGGAGNVFISSGGYSTRGNDGQKWNHPEKVIRFIERFDTNCYPDLILDFQSA